MLMVELTEVVVMEFDLEVGRTGTAPPALLVDVVLMNVVLLVDVVLMNVVLLVEEVLVCGGGTVVVLDAVDERAPKN
jgi:hypothetical protein